MVIVALVISFVSAAASANNAYCDGRPSYAEQDRCYRVNAVTTMQYVQQVNIKIAKDHRVKPYVKHTLAAEARSLDANVRAGCRDNQCVYNSYADRSLVLERFMKSLPK